MLSSKAKLFLNSTKSVRIIGLANLSTPQKFNATLDPSQLPTDKEKRPPFMKNIFLGIFDDIFLQYPELKKNEPSSNLQNLMSDILVSSTDKHLSTYGKFKGLVKGGLLKCRLPADYGGIDMSYSEVINLYEELKLEPSVSVLLETQYSLVLQTILNHGSDDLKQKYLPKLISGDISGAYALCEESGSDPTAVKSFAKEDDDCYRLSGEKIWVTNAENADFFVVFANHIGNKSTFVKELSVFLVEKDNSLILEKHNLLGLNDCGLCKVKFQNIAVPKSNLIGKLGGGYLIAGDSLRFHKNIVLVSILNNLKHLLSSAISHIHDRKQFPVDVKDCELVKDKLTKITCMTYAFESMIYLTCGILDKYIMDDVLESVILQLFGFEKLLKAIDECIDLLGSRGYDAAYSFESLWRDLKGISICIKNIDILKIYVSLTGIDHAGNNLRDLIMKNRNPFNYPSFAFKQAVEHSRHLKDKPKLKLKLYLNLHPNLKASADQLEYCILRLQYVIEVLLSRHGSEITKRQLELMRVADIASDIYAMVAVLSRSSKSYCTGVQFCDQEVAVAVTFCFDRFIRIKNNIHDILHLEKKLSDIYSLDISSHVLINNSYFFVHPLKPSIV